MPRELNEARKNIGLPINRMRTQSMKNQWCSDKNIRLDVSLITDTSTYVFLSRSLNMENNIIEELDRRRKAARRTLAATFCMSEIETFQAEEILTQTATLCVLASFLPSPCKIFFLCYLSVTLVPRPRSSVVFETRIVVG
ncbi:hypothetical protein KIN20_030530 [Parelaphostrongylus tenuis]|uniref:Uncharacterized protein n=1 Tax=Parelaphostrongylus tenuis TaxID=148309 RepID=A0AAD5R466_PARTN|nr:hypothetical protein KIN20_030530 [Parelaphostrongylus tenuis]